MLPKLQVIFNSSHKVNNIYKKFNELGMKSKMIIQVHDEIVCEVPNEEVYFIHLTLLSWKLQKKSLNLQCIELLINIPGKMLE
jgi:DNA polymerase I-like protein with 3'-5' exonuclease and polymerase domains